VSGWAGTLYTFLLLTKNEFNTSLISVNSNLILSIIPTLTHLLFSIQQGDFYLPILLLTYVFLSEIVYCVANAGSELFQSRVTCAARAPGEGRISSKTEIAFPHEPHILFFITPLRSSITAKVMHYAEIYATTTLL